MRAYLFGHFNFDEMFVFLGGHDIDRVGRFEHVDEKFVGQNI